MARIAHLTTIDFGAGEVASLSGALDGLRIGTAGLDACNRLFGIPVGPGELGVAVGDIPCLVERALADHSHPTNPRVASARRSASRTATWSRWRRTTRRGRS